MDKPGFREEPGLVSMLNSKITIVKATTPSGTSKTLIYSDTNLYGKYMILGYGILYKDESLFQSFVTSNHIRVLEINPNGISMQLESNSFTNREITICLIKL